MSTSNFSDKKEPAPSVSGSLDPITLRVWRDGYEPTGKELRIALISHFLWGFLIATAIAIIARGC